MGIWTSSGSTRYTPSYTLSTARVNTKADNVTDYQVWRASGLGASFGRSSDNTTRSYSSDATTGAAPVSSISSFIGAGNGFVATWNDQSGNGNDVSQATSAQQPKWVASAANSKPGVQVTAAGSDILATASAVTIGAAPVALTAFIVLTTSGGGSALEVFGSGWNSSPSGGMILFVRGSTTPILVSAELLGDTTGNGPQVIANSALPLSGYHIIDVNLQESGATDAADLYVDGASIGVDNSVNGFTAGLNYPVRSGSRRGNGRARQGGQDSFHLALGVLGRVA